MKGKLAVLLILLLTIVVLVFVWIWMQGFIKDNNIERALTYNMNNSFFKET